MFKIHLNITLYLLMSVCSSSSWSQELFYHDRGALATLLGRVQVRINGQYYLIHGGSFSPHGSYVSGVLITDRVREYLSTRDAPGITDFYNLDSLRFVVYSLISGRVVHDELLDFVPEVKFSTDENRLLLLSPRGGCSILDLLSDRETQTPDSVSGNATWSGSLVCYLKFDSQRVTLYGFDISTKKSRHLASWKVDVHFPDVVRYEILDSTRVVLGVNSVKTGMLTVLDSRGTVRSIRFHRVMEIQSKGSKLLVIGIEDTAGDAIFEVELSSLKYKRLVDLSMILESFPKSNLGRLVDPSISGISQLFASELEIVFLTRSLETEDTNLFRFRVADGKLTKVTSSGHITSPIGIVGTAR